MQNNSGSSTVDFNLVTTYLDKLFTGEANLTREGKAYATDPVVFTQDRAYNASVHSTVQGGGGYFQVTTSDVPTPIQATVTSATGRNTIVSQFIDNLPISRTFMEDQQLSSVAKAVKDRGMAWAATRDRNAFNVIALGFTSQTTIDGATLYSDTHTNQDGDTVDNKETGSLTDDNLNTLINSLRKQLAQSGYIAGYEPDYLLTPVALHRTGIAVAKSVLRAGSGNNDVNYWSEAFPGMKVVYSPFLDTTSSTAYFVGSKNNGVTRFDRESFSSTLVPWQNQANDMYLYKMRSREAVDSIYYNGTAGSTGTT